MQEDSIASVRANASYSIWIVRGREVMLRFLVPATEAERAVGAGQGAPVGLRLGAYLLTHTAVRTAGGVCPAENQGYDIGRANAILAGEGLYGFEIFFRCPATGAMTLDDDALFDRVVGQVNFARIELRSGVRQGLFTASRRQITLSPSGAISSAAPGVYAKLGAAHVLHSQALWCLLVGSVWLLVRAQKLRWLSLALAAGYIASLGATLGAWIVPRGELLTAYGGLLVALLPLQYVARRLRHPVYAAAGSAAALCALGIVAWSVHRPMGAVLFAGAALLASGVVSTCAARSDDAPLGVAVVFLAAFLDGFTLSREVAPLHLPPAVRLPMLAGFDVGSALVAAALVVFAFAACHFIARSVPNNPQFAGPAATLATDVAAAGLGALGVFWLVSATLMG